MKNSLTEAVFSKKSLSCLPTVQLGSFNMPSSL